MNDGDTYFIPDIYPDIWYEISPKIACHLLSYFYCFNNKLYVYEFLRNAVLNAQKNEVGVKNDLVKIKIAGL